MNRFFFLLSALILAALMLFIRLYVEPTSWLNIWGAYFLVVPLVFSLFVAFIGRQMNYKYLILLPVGVVIGILLYRGGWADNYVVHKILATLSGTLVTALIYLWIKR